MNDGTILLESDTGSRLDFKSMVVNEWEQAEEHKLAYENLQRADKAGR